MASATADQVQMCGYERVVVSMGIVLFISKYLCAYTYQCIVCADWSFDLYFLFVKLHAVCVACLFSHLLNLLSATNGIAESRIFESVFNVSKKRN